MTATPSIGRTIAALAALALPGCMTPQPMPELAEIPDASPPGFERSVEAAIEDSLPRVSYSPESPDYLGPLVQTAKPAKTAGRTMDRELIQGWIRKLESLDGEDAVVCRGTRDAVFGYCSFPDSER